MKLNPEIHSKNSNINQFFSFHNSPDSEIIFQNSTAPFMLNIMNCQPHTANPVIMSTLLPGAQFNYSINTEMKEQRKSGMHQHNYFEFMYILKGSMYQIVEKKRYFYSTGSCCLLNRNTLHTEEYSSDYVCIFFTVSTDFISRLTNYGYSLLFPEELMFVDNIILNFLKDNLESEHKNTKDFLDFVPKITETEQKRIVHDIFEQMITTILNPFYGATYQLQVLFCKLIFILSNTRYYNIEYITANTRSNSFLLARIDQLLSERNGRITNSELAQILNYDGSYIGRIVKKSTGKSLFEYSMDFTMTAAESMLRNTEMSIARIAEELRFTNRAHFYKIFQQHFHMTPKQYRENLVQK
ncbi:hypothetical protein B5F07_08955 [Lachnoclostridium sp. An169]|uniref:helix-turn-helix domain-containing protein n=1 Tax=Lachnoclostridium sp. An169 TaxID=1965569 RepID=UPI000B37D88E|nr:AraC family transcriptional regulator [Lachnoclostridium sp. An169]OUP83972.1 hypothetical protein B5F07_08955 [Lachnoclostridium sp. An169]